MAEIIKFVLIFSCILTSCAAINCSDLDPNSIFSSEEVLKWLDSVEHQFSVTNQTSHKVHNFTEEIKCKNAKKSGNSCRFLNYTDDPLISRINGTMYNFNFDSGKLQLKARLDDGGYWHGLVAGFQKWYTSLNMTLIAKFDHGSLATDTPVWTLLEENGFIVSDNLEVTGSDIVYIYPGLKFALRGQFVNKEMVSARLVTIDGFKCQNGIMKPLTTFVQENQNEFTHDPADSITLSMEPLLRDPLDFHYLEVRPSTIPGAGEGVFLKRDAQKGTVVGFFNGVHITLEDTLHDLELKKSVHKMWNDWETDEMVNIPKEYIDINAYNATLGHKINHNTEANVDAGYVDHPRFGKIRSIVTIKDLKAGDELFCQYSPTVDGGTFVRQIFKDFINYIDMEDAEDKSNFLNTMRSDYQTMMNSMGYDPDEFYRKPK